MSESPAGKVRSGQSAHNMLLAACVALAYVIAIFAMDVVITKSQYSLRHVLVAMTLLSMAMGLVAFGVRQLTNH